MDQDNREWQEYEPPKHVNCRCTLVPIGIIDLDDIGYWESEINKWVEIVPRIYQNTSFSYN